MSCFSIQDSTFCSAWNGKQAPSNFKLQNSNVMITDTASLDAAVSDVFQLHYGLINSNCQKNFDMPNYAAWLCDSLFESGQCSSTRICAATCTKFSQEYTNLTNTCQGDFQTSQKDLSNQIAGYCSKLNSTGCISPDMDLVGNCGYHTKANICSNCQTKIDSYCKAGGLMGQPSFKTLSIVLLVLGILIVLGMLTCVICFRITKNKKKIRKLNKRQSDLNSEDYFYDEITNEVITPRNSNTSISGSSLTLSTSTMKNTLPVTRVGQYSEFIRNSRSSMQLISPISELEVNDLPQQLRFYNQKSDSPLNPLIEDDKKMEEMGKNPNQEEESGQSQVQTVLEDIPVVPIPELVEDKDANEDDDDDEKPLGNVVFL